MAAFDDIFSGADVYARRYASRRARAPRTASGSGQAAVLARASGGLEDPSVDYLDAYQSGLEQFKRRAPRKELGLVDLLAKQSSYMKRGTLGVTRASSFVGGVALSPSLLGAGY